MVAISEAQQETCNESWMVDFSLSTLICDADEPGARLPQSPPSSPSGSLDGFIRKKEIKLRFGLVFKMILRLP